MKFEEYDGSQLVLRFIASHLHRNYKKSQRGDRKVLRVMNALLDGLRFGRVAT